MATVVQWQSQLTQLVLKLSRVTPMLVFSITRRKSPQRLVLLD